MGELLSAAEQVEYHSLFANKREEALRGLNDPRIDTDPLFLEAIKRLNQLEFAYTTGSCSGHVENPLGDPYDFVELTQGRAALPGIVKEEGLVKAPIGQQLVIFGFVGLELDRLNARSEQLIDRSLELRQLFANLEVEHGALHHMGNTLTGKPMFSQGLLLRLHPPQGLQDTGYSRYDFFSLYLADNQVAGQIQFQFQDLWRGVARIAASI